MENGMLQAIRDASGRAVQHEDASSRCNKRMRCAMPKPGAKNRRFATPRRYSKRRSASQRYMVLATRTRGGDNAESGASAIKHL